MWLDPIDLSYKQLTGFKTGYGSTEVLYFLIIYTHHTYTLTPTHTHTGIFHISFQSHLTSRFGLDFTE